MKMLLFFALPFATALVMAFVMMLKPTRATQARRWTIVFMLDCALTTLLLAHYYHPALRLSIPLDLLYDIAILSIGPCIYACIRSLTSLSGLQKRDAWIVQPSLALFLIICLLYLIMPQEERILSLSETTLGLTPVTTGHTWAFRAYRFFGYEFFRSFVIIQTLAVLIWGVRTLREYEQTLADYLTTTEAIALRTRNLLRIGFVLFGIFGMLLATFEYEPTFIPWVMPAFCIGISIAIACMGIYARRIRYSAEILIHMEKEATASENGGIKQQEDAPCSEKNLALSRLAIIEDEHLYRDPNLTIFSLSRIIGTNRTYLTRDFRECYNETFSEHINRLRIEEAIRLMTESPNLTLQEIASRVGYNSATSLYRNFVRIHHCSPSEYSARQSI